MDGIWRSKRVFWPEQAAARREANASSAWMATADRNEAPRGACAWTDGWRCVGDDEDGKADGEGAPSHTAAPGAGRSRAPERYRRDGATSRR